MKTGLWKLFHRPVFDRKQMIVSLCLVNDLKGEIRTVVVDAENGLGGDILGDELFGDEGLDLSLDKPFQRSCAEVLIVALRDDRFLGFIGNLDGEVLVGKAC